MALRPTSGMGFIRASGGAVLMVAPGKDEGLDPETVIWLERCIAAGGNPRSSSIQIADKLIRAIKDRTYNTKIKYLLPLLGNNLACARVPLRDKLDVGIATSTAFVEADFSESTGLQGNGSTKYLDSLIRPSQLGLTDNGGLGWWENNIDLTGNVEPMGCYKQNNSPDNRFVLDIRTTRGAFLWGLPANVVSDGTAAANGHYYGQRSSATSRQAFRNGVLSGTNTTSDSPSGTSDNTILICGANEGAATGIAPWPGRCAVAYMTTGNLTSAEATNLHSLLNTKLLSPTRRPS